MGRISANYLSLQQSGNDVLVIVAPFNRHMISDKGLAGFTAIHDGAVQWLREKGVPCVAPSELSSELYADASHPLTAGYESLAKTVFKNAAFQKWIGRTSKKGTNMAHFNYRNLAAYLLVMAALASVWSLLAGRRNRPPSADLDGRL